MSEKPENVLVIAPHMDDEILGVGGTVCRHVALGDWVTVVFVCTRHYNHVFNVDDNASEEQDAGEAQAVLGYHERYFLRQPDERLDLYNTIKALEAKVRIVDPRVVYVNHGGDNHQDHRVVFDAAMVVLRQSAVPNVRKILSYETPSSTDQASPTSSPFLPTSYHEISHHLETKLTAIGCYSRELRQPPHPRSIEAVRALAVLRGNQSGCTAAEAFMVIREKWMK